MLGLGSVFLTPYRTLIERLAAEGRAELVAAYDIDPGKREAVGRRTGADVSMAGPEELIARDDLDVVLVLTSMLEHGRLALEALRGRQARAGREADGDRARRRPRAGRGEP